MQKSISVCKKNYSYGLHVSIILSLNLRMFSVHYKKIRVGSNFSSNQSFIIICWPNFFLLLFNIVHYLIPEQNQKSFLGPIIEKYFIVIVAFLNQLLADSQTINYKINYGFVGPEGPKAWSNETGMNIRILIYSSQKMSIFGYNT